MHEKITLPNGVRIVFERIDHVRSASVGFWIGTGSRYEKAAENGAAHFIEHMLFKGTQNMKAAERASEGDRLGGQVNAFTTKEMTALYGRFLDVHLPYALDILCDMFFSSQFYEKEVEVERGVICEEISMYADTPEDLVMERLFGSVFRGSPLARPILGTKRTLERMSGEFLKEYQTNTYTGDKIVVALSGSFNDRDVEYLKQRFSAVQPSKKSRELAGRYTPSVVLKKKRIEQNHICLAFPGLDLYDKKRYAFQLMNSIFGGNMSSRLFQHLREELGLCYSVSSFGVAHNDVGLFCVATAVSKDTEELAIQGILKEIERIKNEGVSEEELARTREQVKANVVMGLESTQSRMNRLGRNELLFGYIKDIDDVISEYDAVTCSEIHELAVQCMDIQRMSFSAVGNLREASEYKKFER